MAPSPQLPRRLVYVRLDDLPDHPRNPRDHRLPDLRMSVMRFGFTSPPMIDGRTGLLAEGHGRKKATILLRDEHAGAAPPDLPDGRPWPPEGVLIRDGAWLVPVVHGWSSIDDTEAEAYLLAGNQGGGWQNEGLAAILEELTATPLGFAGVGLSQADYDLVLSEIALSTGAGGVDPYAEWEGMPDYESASLESRWRVHVHFKTEEDYVKFLERDGNPTLRQSAYWWPKDDGHKGEDWTQQYVTVEEGEAGDGGD